MKRPHVIKMALYQETAFMLLKPTLSIVCAAATTVISACTPAAAPAPKVVADVIYMGGDIVTVNDAQPSVEALAVKDGKILALGSREQIEVSYQGASTARVDLAGKTLLPGFIDPHSQPSSHYQRPIKANVYASPAGPGRPRQGHSPHHCGA